MLVRAGDVRQDAGGAGGHRDVRGDGAKREIVGEGSGALVDVEGGGVGRGMDDADLGCGGYPGNALAGGQWKGDGRQQDGEVKTACAARLRPGSTGLSSAALGVDEG